MRHLLLISIMVVVVIAGAVPSKVNAQTGNIDWETLWIDAPYYMPPDTAYFSFLRDSTAYTSLAYDSLRKLIYVVSPATQTIGGVVVNRPRIYVLDAASGLPVYDVGRSCDPSRLGLGGELPVPLDTIVPSKTGYGFAQGKYCIYKIDMDDEGRIFVCNLVAPLWGACVDLDGDGNCNGVTDKRELDLKNQGPFRVWRWDTPTSTPVLVYATLDSSATAIGNLNNSEQTHTRWGDGFDVVGKRGMYDPGGGKTPYLVDSARIYVSGGSWLGQTEWNNEVNMLVADMRPAASRPKGEQGTAMDYRLGLKLVNSVHGLAAHGIAVTAGTADSQTVWMESCPNPTSAAPQVFHPGAPLPQVYYQPSPNRSVNTNVTGPAGAIRFFPCKNYNRDLIIVADGLPTSGSGRNDNTTARVIDVTQTNADSVVLNPTPQLGIKPLTNVSGSQNYCSAVDYTLDPGDDGNHLIVYILMSNNGFAAFRSRRGGMNCSYAWPIHLTSLRAALNADRIDLTWLVTGEQMNYGFDLQRSFDAGREWRSIGFVPGRGNSDEAHEYAFSDPLTDEHTRAGVVRYRLHQLDSDGSSSYSPSVDVLMPAATSVELEQNYPNPFSSGTVIRYSLPEQAYVSFSVYDLFGRKMAMLQEAAQSAGRHEITFRRGELPAGMYYCRLTVSGKTRLMRMVVE